MSPVSRRSLFIVLALAALLTTVLAVPLQAAVFSSPIPAYCNPGWTYTVQSGDTLFSIARRYGTTVTVLQQCNGLTNVNYIYRGQLLLIPGGTPPNPTVPPSGCVNYTVVYGDTLYSIAKKYSTTVSVIAVANGIANVNLIWPGQVLKINCGTVNPPPTVGSWYQVKAGDTVSAIAVKFGVSIWQVISLNHLQYPYIIYVGQWLRIS